MSRFKQQPDSVGTWLDDRGEPIVVQMSAVHKVPTLVVFECGTEEAVRVGDLPAARKWVKVYDPKKGQYLFLKKSE